MSQLPQPSQYQSFTEYLSNDLTLEMVAIPGGTFIMGAPENELKSNDNERPQHQVTIKPFLMGKYTITQSQWKAVANLPKIQRYLNPDHSKLRGKNQTVAKVSWYDAVEFCARLSKKTGHNYRLPSEAEWEYACRAGTTTPFYFGQTITTNQVNHEAEYFYDNSPEDEYGEQTLDVGQFPPNTFGLYDMHGNVWEWCADPWHNSYHGSPNDGRVWDENCKDNRYKNYIDLLVKSKNDNRERLLRGGSCSHFPDFCRAAYRSFDFPDERTHDYGFRVVFAAP